VDHGREERAQVAAPVDGPSITATQLSAASMEALTSVDRSMEG
jgi:hypothetical protein